MEDYHHGHHREDQHNHSYHYRRNKQKNDLTYLKEENNQLQNDIKGLINRNRSRGRSATKNNHDNENPPNANHTTRDHHHENRNQSKNEANQNEPTFRITSDSNFDKSGVRYYQPNAHETSHG